MVPARPSVLLALVCLQFITPTFAASRRLHQQPSPPAAPINVCIPLDLTTRQLSACQSALSLIANATSGVTFTCVAGVTVEGCLSQVQAGQAQLAKVPASGVYAGQKSYGLQPLVAEFFSVALGNYVEGYAVALVSTSLCPADGSAQLQASALANKNACFSGFLTDGGWNVAVGDLIAGGVSVRQTANYTSDADTMRAFFNEVCAPGHYAKAPKLNGGTTNRICSLCNDTTHTCDVDDPWYGAGAVTGCGPSADVVFTELPDPSTTQAPTPAAGSPPTSSPVVTNSPAAGVPPPPPHKKRKKKKKKHHKSPGMSPGASPSPTAAGSPSPPPPSRRRSRTLLAQSSPSPTDTKVLWCLSQGGTCLPNAPSNYATCNLAVVPSQAFVATAAFAGSAAGAAAQAALVKGGTDAAGFMAAAAGVGKGPFVLVTKGATSLTPVNVTTEQYLGTAFAKAMGETQQVQAATAGGSPSTSGLPQYAVIALAVAAAVAALLVVGGCAYWCRRRGQNSSYQKYQDVVREINMGKVRPAEGSRSRR